MIRRSSPLVTRHSQPVSPGWLLAHPGGSTARQTGFRSREKFNLIHSFIAWVFAHFKLSFLSRHRVGKELKPNVCAKLFSSSVCSFTARTVLNTARPHRRPPRSINLTAAAPLLTKQWLIQRQGSLLPGPYRHPNLSAKQSNHKHE